MDTTTEPRRPKAFISCSLRPEDEAFVKFVESVVQCFGFHSIGSVGRPLAAPQPIWQQMRDTIQSCDCVILAATPRYVQQDLDDRANTRKGLSEMLHVEVGMAVASNRPILAFVLEGTDVGSFLPQTIQYITIKPNDRKDLENKWPMIANYFRSALAIVQDRWRRECLLPGILATRAA